MSKGINPTTCKRLGKGCRIILAPPVREYLKDMANAIIPAAEVAATNQVTAPAATILTAPATEQKEPQTNSTSRRRRSTTPPMWRVMTQARPVFDVQLKKDNEIKLACIDKFMNAAYSDANKFWADFMEQVNILLDSRRYCRECKILGLKPEYVAEHIVFLGSATMKKVLKDGVSRTLGADVQLYGKRFSPEDADRFLSEDIKRLPEQTTVA
ncbi:hypothetical protein Alfi_2625 [Alistipes finegoldii DSM 17242]|uniref:Uncharacterized protein n=2 Tax=Alistipes finegoldii TaxID=214856 RepID=I3YPG8_ALIFI|nr:hypothetical protein Alfi_2625 [Alistipes finegoldii DSM 17242]